MHIILIRARTTLVVCMHTTSRVGVARIPNTVYILLYYEYYSSSTIAY